MYMTHLYDYYKSLPRDNVVGGFLEFAGGDDGVDDIELSSDDDTRGIHAEIYGAADHLKSASTIDEGILRLFGDDEMRQINPKKSRDTPEDARTNAQPRKWVKPRRRRKSGKHRAGGVDTVDAADVVNTTDTTPGRAEVLHEPTQSAEDFSFDAVSGPISADGPIAAEDFTL
jgi:hypothetical protein